MIIRETWPALQNSGSNIILPASRLRPALVKVGGRAITVVTQLSVALPSLTANTRYQVFLVAPIGVPALVISTNENSVGPIGYASWKLLGSFYSDGLVSVGFGSFSNIEGIPTTNWTPFNAAIANMSVGTYVGLLQRNGDSARIKIHATSSGSVTGDITPSFPSNLTGDNNKVLSTNAIKAYLGIALGLPNSGANYFEGTVTYNSTTTIKISDDFSSSGNPWAASVPAVWNNTGWLSVDFMIPILGWTNTALKDL